MTVSSDTLMVRRPRAVSNHEGFDWRDRGTASCFETRVALLTMRLTTRLVGELEKTR